MGVVQGPTSHILVAIPFRSLIPVPDPDHNAHSVRFVRQMAAPYLSGGLSCPSAASVVRRTTRALHGMRSGENTLDRVAPKVTS